MRLPKNYRLGYPGDRHLLRTTFWHLKEHVTAASSSVNWINKINEMLLPKIAAYICPSNKCLIIIDQSPNTSLLNIALGCHPPFEPITALFIFTGMWPGQYVRAGCDKVHGFPAIVFWISVYYKPRNGHPWKGEALHCLRCVGCKSILVYYKFKVRFLIN